MNADAVDHCSPAEYSGRSASAAVVMQNLEDQHEHQQPMAVVYCQTVAARS
jgi:hypothetical protein